MAAPTKNGKIPDPAPPPRVRTGVDAGQGTVAAPAEKRGFAEARLLTHWEEIVGAEIAAIALPLQDHLWARLRRNACPADDRRACPGAGNARHRDRGACERLLRLPRRVAGAGDADGAHGFAEGQVAFRTAPKAG
jgi:hypothetical protein